MKSISRLCLRRLGTISSFKRTYASGEQKEGRPVVVVTGCDSGLGYSLSLKSAEYGFSVVSGCLDVNSEGAQLLRNKAVTHPLDVRCWKSVKKFRESVDNFLQSNNLRLHALVNNAGVMIFGEFEWLTEQQITEHVEVNALGYFRVAKEFLPLLRKYKGRLINVTSHCSIANLPSLSVYGATKAAVQSWSDGLRVEQAKYGVKVITFIPGSFPMQSNIMSRQEHHAAQMESEFLPEQKAFYTDYFKLFNSNIIGIARQRKSLAPIEDELLFAKFIKCLTSRSPYAHYKREHFRYFIYYSLFRITPVFIRDYLVVKFMQFPVYKRNQQKRTLL